METYSNTTREDSHSRERILQMVPQAATRRTAESGWKRRHKHGGMDPMEDDIRENNRHNERKEQIRKMAPGCTQVALAVGGTRGEKPGRIPDSQGCYGRGQRHRKRKTSCTLVAD